MTKIIPFAVAVILVLGAGYYLFTTRIVKQNQTQNTAVTDTVPTNGTVIGSTPTMSPTSIVVAPTGINEKSNQISLTVSEPQDAAVVTSPSLTVKGVTVPNAEVSINEKDVKANASGGFTATISLEEGDNYVAIVAVDADGNVAEKELNITYTPN